MSEGRRTRRLSEADHQLWEKVVADVAPLAPKKRRRPSRAVVPAEPPPAAPPAVAAAAPHPVAAPEKPKRAPALPPLAPIDRRTVSRMVRGSLAIDERIDLHGLTQAEAHRRLLAFLGAAQVRGSKLALVITGKGRPIAGHDWFDPKERGVLRRMVPHWLALPEFRPLVVGYEEAHVTHGGAGALYVRLRRAKGEGAR